MQEKVKLFIEEINNLIKESSTYESQYLPFNVFIVYKHKRYKFWRVLNASLDGAIALGRYLKIAYPILEFTIERSQ